MRDIIFAPSFKCVLHKKPNSDYALLYKYRSLFYACDKKFMSEDNLITYSNIDEFLKSNTQGRFNVIVDSLPLKCCLIDSHTENEFLFISYTGARTENNKATPIFPRWSYYKITQACFLCFDDPMFTSYPDLLLGWYYGTKDRCYIDSTIKLIKRVCEKKDIPLDKCIFFSSSGGGYASILASILLPKTLSISINPQLYISEFAYAKKFSEITGIVLDNDDPLLRNNLVQKIKKESCSKHVIIVNIRSESDYSQLIKFVNEFGIDSLRYGLNLISPNVLVWLYDAVPALGQTTHTAFESRQIYKFIEYVSLEFKNNPNFDCDEYQSLVVMINELWWFKNYAPKNLEKTESKFKFFDISSPICTNLLSQVNNICIKKSDFNYNFYNLPITKFYSHYSIVISNVSSNVQEFSYGLYDWNNKKFIIYKIKTIDADKEYIVNFFIDFPTTSKISFLIYAGICGKTKNNQLNISKLCVYS